MSKDILLLGEFSTGKSAFINMLLGVSILPERLESTDLPVIKIHNDKPSGIWLREEGEKNPRGLESWSDIPRNWEIFEYAEITIPSHPLLNEGLVIWDTPGINSTNHAHIDHLNKFLHKKNFTQVYFFIHGNVTKSTMEFINKYKHLRGQMFVIVNIKEVKPKEDCLKLASQAKKDIWTNYGNIPVELLYIGEMYDEFAQLTESKREGDNDWELIKNWEKRKIDISNLLNKYKSENIGNEIFEIIKWKESDKEFLPITNSNYVAEKEFVQAALNTINILSDNKSIKNKKLGIELLQRSYEEGYKEAGVQLANHLAEGRGIKKDTGKAEQLLRDIAVTGHASAKYNLGRLYINHRENYEDGLRYIKESAEAGDPDAIIYLINRYKETDLAEALNWLNKSELKNSALLYLHGDFHYMGVYGEQNLDKAIEFYKKAADQGFSDAQNKLGVILRNKKRVKEAFDYFKLAANQNDPFGYANVAFCYTYGVGCRKNLKQAISWYGKGVERGNLASITGLGRIFLNGEGVRRNNKKAFDYFKRAAKEAYAEAQFYLGRCYGEGWGTRVNRKKSVEQYMKSAEQKYADAQHYVGCCFKKGLGITQNINEAYRWYELAIENGCEAAIESINKLNKEYNLIAAALNGSESMGQSRKTQVTCCGEGLEGHEIYCPSCKKKINWN